MTGMVTEIERFALSDGPGIRTTVFFKGCDLRCAWCHNPETIRPGRDVHYYARNCIGCLHCAAVCPHGAHSGEPGLHRFAATLCTRCGRCAAVCYPGAMALSGTAMTVEQVMAQVQQDLPYYRSSGGGVTLSGGEGLCQPGFALALIEACHALDISVCLETNLHRPFDDVAAVLTAADLILCDLKLIDAEAHRRLTRADNAQILQNIHRLDTLRRPYAVRTPVVPGATDSDANILGIAAFLATCPHLLYYELLNFNPLGGPKYASLSLPDPYAGVMPLPTARMRALAALAQGAGVQTRADG
jgi:pyruvate formate lyase activating enzyme